MNTPMAFKVFLWKTCHNVLPITVNLRLKKAMDTNLCPIYCMAREDVLHVLWLCVVATNVWCVCCRKVQKLGVNIGDFLQLMENLCTFLYPNELAEVAVIMRQLCLRRNFVLFEDSFIHPNVLVTRAVKNLNDF